MGNMDRLEQAAYDLDGWQRQLAIWYTQLDEFPADTLDGRLLRLQIEHGEAFRDQYQRLLSPP